MPAGLVGRRTKLGAQSRLITTSQAPQGNWVGAYGHDGYDLLAWNGASPLVAMPLCAVYRDTGSSNQWLASANADARCLQSPDTLSRKATSDYDFTAVAYRLAFPAAYTGTLHLYLLDWDSIGRRVNVIIGDALGSRDAGLSATDFTQGLWVHAPITVLASGVVTIAVPYIGGGGGGNSVISGIFLGGA